MKLDLKNMRKAGKSTNTGIVNNKLLNNQWVKEKKIKREIKEYLKMNE